MTKPSAATLSRWQAVGWIHIPIKASTVVSFLTELKFSRFQSVKKERLVNASEIMSVQPTRIALTGLLQAVCTAKLRIKFLISKSSPNY